MPIISLSWSIAMIDFLHPSRFGASFGSNCCSISSLRTLSIHFSLGLLRDIFPHIFIVVISLSTSLSSLLIAWEYQERRFWVSWHCGDWIDHCAAPELFFADSSFPCFALHSSQHFQFRLALCSSNTHCRVKVGLMTVLYGLIFSLTCTFLSHNITPDKPLRESPADLTLISTFVQSPSCSYC